MQHHPTSTTPDLHHAYHQNRQAIEQRLRNEIAQFRSERDKLDPRSTLEAERWSAAIYNKLLQRREQLLRILSTGSCTA